MKRKFFSATLTVSALMLIAGLFACSDDKDDFSYLSCEEAYTTMMSIFSDPAIADLFESCADDLGDSDYEPCYELDGDIFVECVEDIVEACVVSSPTFKGNANFKKLCGDNSMDVCNAHYESKCDDGH